LKQIVEACGGAQQAFQLMMLEHLDKLAETSAKAISNIKFDKIVVWENGGGDGRSNTADFLHKMAGALPPMMQVMKDIGGVDIPTSLATLVGADGTGTNGESHANGAERAIEPETPVVVKPRV
jgi:flotillin